MTITFSTALGLIWLAAAILYLAKGLALLCQPRPRRAPGHLMATLALLPAAAALLTLLLSPEAPLGPMPTRGVSGWLLAALILTLGAVIQRFSLRFLLGDRDQPRVQGGIAIATLSAAMSWLTLSPLVLVISWGLALLALVRLIGVASDWPAAQASAHLAGRVLFCSWLALAAASGLPALAGTLPTVAIDYGIAALVLIAAFLPAAQWPAQRWLMSSLVAPTPVSAIMHAGLVNGGALLLISHAGVIEQVGWAQPLLLIMAAISLLVGAGMALVQVEVKRHLAASTVAQMGCMLVQCALGAYIAALIHLILHALFKANLFLQAGGQLAQPAPLRRRYQLLSTLTIGITLSLAIVALLPGNARAADWFSALLLGMAAGHALAALGATLKRMTGWLWLTGLALSFVAGQYLLRQLLEGPLPQSAAPPWPWLVGALVLLVGGATLLEAARQMPRYRWSRWLYMQLVAAAEANPACIDAHPEHLHRRHLRSLNQQRSES
ncbi:MAG: hypothetical protein II007_03010 [Gammaproteobacteria bacterium]|nr:hypothetical protein [Gammaproteobacteria bacterium]